MNNDIILFDIASISNTKTQMDSKYNELVGMVSKYKGMIEETKAIYDTESATLFRKVATMYAELLEKFLNDELKPYIDKLDEIKKAYLEEVAAVEKNVQEVE